MLKIELTVKAAGARVIAGETLPVRVMVINSGSDPEPIVNPNDPSPYEYRLFPEGKDTPRYVVSSESISQRTIRAPMPKPKPLPPYMLQGGRRTDRVEDLASLTVGGYEPGRYMVQATWNSDAGKLTSNRAPVEITVPNFSAFVSETGRRGSPLAVAAANQYPDQIAIFHQEPDQRQPGVGPFYPRASFTPAPVQLAAAVDAEPAGGGRWVAWLHEGVFEAVFGHADKSPKPFTQAIQPADAHLLPVGYQFRERTAYFFLFAGHASRQTLLLLTVSSGEGIRLSSPIELSGPEGGLPIPSIHLRETLDLYWAVNKDSRTRVVRQSADLAAGKATPATILANLPGNLAAFDCARVAADSVHLLLDPFADEKTPPDEKPSEEQKEMRYYRLRVDQPASDVQPLVLPAPPNPVSEWAILAGEAHLPVLAIDADRVWGAMAEGGGWRKMGGRTGCRWPKLFSFHDSKIWAQWIDPLRGPVRIMIDEK